MEYVFGKFHIVTSETVSFILFIFVHIPCIFFRW